MVEKHLELSENSGISTSVAPMNTNAPPRLLLMSLSSIPS